jgi:hypothetical protein
MDELGQRREELKQQIQQKQPTVRDRIEKSIEDASKSIVAATEARERSIIALKMLDENPVIEEFLNLIGERKPTNG